MSRTKPKDMVTSFTEAVNAMKTINDADAKIAHWKIEETKAITLVKKKFAAIRVNGGYEVLVSEKKLLIKELERWGKKDASKWKAKTLKTPYGRIGFRKSTPAVKLIKRIAKNFQEALKFLIDGSWHQYVRTVEEIDKDAILADVRDKALTNEELETCGLKVDQKEEFWVESNAARDLDKAVKELKAS